MSPYVDRVPVIGHVSSLRRARVLIVLVSIVVVGCGPAGPADDAQRVAGDGGGRIAFVSNRDGGNADIYVMNADGSNQTRLTASSIFNENWKSRPAWSPDRR